MLKKDVIDYNLRKAVAELGLMLGRLLHDERGRYIDIECCNRKICYQAALAGAVEIPDEVVNFALEASGRTSRIRQPTKTSNCLSNMESMQEPWQDGPKFDLDIHFRLAVLRTNALHPLMRTRPEIAREIILATLINAPKLLNPVNLYEEIDARKRHMEINDLLIWDDPIYPLDGPFLSFLLINFEEGLETIVRLVDFASERWIDYNLNTDSEIVIKRGKRNTDCSEIFLPLEKDKKWLVGSGHIYRWASQPDNVVAPESVKISLMALEQYLSSKKIENNELENKVQIIFNRVQSVAFLQILCNIGKYRHHLFLKILLPLLSVPEIYYYDIHGRNSPFIPLGEMDRGKIIADINKNFREMEHRNINLKELAMWLFVKNEEVQKYLSRARKEWEKRFKDTNDKKTINFLEILIASFNIENYQSKKIKRKIIYENIALKKIQERDAPLLQKIVDESFLLHFPTRCRRMINLKQKLLKKDISSFWNEMQKIEQIDVQSDVKKHLKFSLAEQKANAIAGGIALLVCNQADYLEQHPEKKKWCVSKLQNLVLNPIQPAGYDLPESNADWTWDIFVAEALPILWATDISNPQFRKLAAWMVFSYHHLSLIIFFRRCAECRSILGDDFSRLRRLLFERAYVQHHTTFVERNQLLRQWNKKKVQQLTDVVTDWKQKSIAAFVQQTLPLPVANWEMMDPSVDFAHLDDLPRNQNENFPLEFQLVRIAYEWMPNNFQNLDSQERSDWLSFLRTCLSFIIHYLRLEKNSNQYPSNGAEWVLEQIAVILPLMKKEEQPEEIWQKILMLPNNAHHWVEYFLVDLHVNNLSQDPIPSNFISLRNEIIEYALGKEGEGARVDWSPDSIRWSALMGIGGLRSRISMRVWQARHESIVYQSINLFERWFEKVGMYEDNFNAFVIWLTNEAAKPLRVPALIWLGKVLFSKDEQFYQRKEIDDLIAQILTIIWELQETDLRKNRDAFTAFQEILSSLTGKQNELALVLSSEIGR